MSNPKVLQYNQIKPVGFATKYRQTRFQPSSNIQTYSFNDIVRFLIQTDGFWDPYNCFLEIEIQYLDSQQPGVALQLDSSAQSLINQVIISSNSQEIERIEEYDTIAAILTDMNYSEDLKATKLHEGINSGNRNNFNRPAFNNTQSQAKPNKPTGSWNYMLGQDYQNVNNLRIGKNTLLTNNATLNATLINAFTVPFSDSSTFTNWYASFVGSNLYHPYHVKWLLPQLHPIYNLQTSANNIDTTTNNIGSNTVSVTKAKYINRFIKLISQSDPFIDLGISGNYSGGLIPGPNGQLSWNCSLGEYLQQTRVSGTFYPTADYIADSTKRSALADLIYESRRTEFGMILDNFLQDVQASDGYALDQSYLDQGANFYNTTEANFLLPKYMGYQRPYSLPLSTGFESFQSSNLPQTCLYNGKIQKVPIAYQTKKYSIPLLSAIFGSLMPKDSYRYIPMKYFQNLLFEFRMNPYAFFTSGNKVNGLNNTYFNTVEQPSQRAWQINKFEIFVDLYYFDEVVTSQIDSQASGNGIYLHTASWVLGPQFPIQNTQAIIGNWQINQGFESLKMLMMIFLDSSYTKYSYCRKHWRLSHNITSFQLRFGTEYYPPYPVVGHAGNPMGSNNNSQFYQMLQKAFGKLNDVWGDMGINPINFSLTQRPYDPNAAAQFMTALETPYGSLTSGQSSTFIETYSLQTGQTNTCVGMPWFHENRCIGKAVYAMNLEGFPSDDKIISGMDTTKTRPFEILLNADSANGTLLPSTMMIFCYVDVFLIIKPGGQIQVIGK